jgi:hypothetical protein
MEIRWKQKLQPSVNQELALGLLSFNKPWRKWYGTPLYLYDEDQIRDKIGTFQAIFAVPVFATEIIYASKAFLAPLICTLMREADVWQWMPSV